MINRRIQKTFIISIHWTELEFLSESFKKSRPSEELMQILIWTDVAKWKNSEPLQYIKRPQNFFLSFLKLSVKKNTNREKKEKMNILTGALLLVVHSLILFSETTASRKMDRSKSSESTETQKTRTSGAQPASMLRNNLLSPLGSIFGRNNRRNRRNRKERLVSNNTCTSNNFRI